MKTPKNLHTYIRNIVQRLQKNRYFTCRSSSKARSKNANQHLSINRWYAALCGSSDRVLRLYVCVCVCEVFNHKKNITAIVPTYIACKNTRTLIYCILTARSPATKAKYARCANTMRPQYVARHIIYTICCIYAIILGWI